VKKLETEIEKKSRQHVELEHEINQVKKQIASHARLEVDPLMSTAGGGDAKPRGTSAGGAGIRPSSSGTTPFMLRRKDQ
jgi:hypothetical protein